MKAARLHEYGKPLIIENVPVPSVKGDEVLVKIAGSGLCHSDLHILSGEMPMAAKLPVTMGHENAGYVEEAGPDAADLRKGDPVVVFGGWGCGNCRFCIQGEEQLCSVLTWVGIGAEGGYAEYLHVRRRRHLLKLEGLDPVEAAPLTDAALTPYRAIKKALPHLYPGAGIAILGVGGLGHFAIQIAKAVAPGASVIAVDVADDKLRLAAELGADAVVDGRGDAAAAIKRISGGEGAQAIIDLVGSSETLSTAAAAVARKGIIVLVGLAGGALPYSFMSAPPECTLTASQWGSYTELQEVLALATAGKVKARIRLFPLEEINEAFQLLKEGRIEGRGVIVP